jgi:hypothetical protein
LIDRLGHDHTGVGGLPLGNRRYTLTFASSPVEGERCLHGSAGGDLLLGVWGYPPILLTFPQEWGMKGVEEAIVALLACFVLNYP